MSWLFGFINILILFGRYPYSDDKEFLEGILKNLGTNQIMMRTFWAFFFFLTLKTMALSKTANILESPVSYQELYFWG